MSKWNSQLDEKLRAMCMEGAPNAEIAKALNMDVADIYARRSKLGITRDKVAEMKGGAEKTCKCDCCGASVADTETYKMPNGEEKDFCKRCAKVLDYVNSF